MALFPTDPNSPNSPRSQATREYLKKNGENQNLNYNELTAADKAAIDQLALQIQRNIDAANKQGNGGLNLSIPIPDVGGLGIACPRPGGGAVLPNPAPVVPSVRTPDLPATNSTSTNASTNRSPFATNPTNVTIRTNTSNTNSNPGSTNRITNGNGRSGGINPRAGFVAP
jgi:hypothetical protein